MVLHFLRHLIFSARAQAIVKTISWLGMIAIFLSTSSFLIVISVMNGMNRSMETRILALEPHMVVWAPGAKQSSREDIQNESYFRWAQEQKNWLVFPFETQDVLIRSNEGKFQGAIARGVTQESLANFNRKLREISRKKNGGYFYIDDELPGPAEIYLGIDLARNLQVLEGDEVSVLSPEALLLPPGEAPKVEKVKVKRLLATNLADLDGHLIMYQSGVTFNFLRESLSRKTGTEIWLPNVSATENAKEDLQERTDGVVESWKERNSDLFFALKLEKSMIGLVLAFAGLISGSSIITVLAILISHKRRDIAILRTLGLSNEQTIKLFTKMGFIISGTAVLMGAALGAAISMYLEKYPLEVLPDIYYDATIPADFRPGLFVAVVVVGITLSFLGSFLPAKAASLIHPATSLKLKH